MKVAATKGLAKTVMILTVIWVTLVLAIGIWWFFLFIQLSKQLPGAEGARLANMIIWEGSFFFLLLLLLTGALAFFYLRHVRQTRSMQAFFLSLTHELKTPLASIRLQAEVLQEKLADVFGQQPKSATVMQRLLSDTLHLETKMDKILQLSQVERDGDVHLTNAVLSDFLARVAKRWSPALQLKIDDPQHAEGRIDEFAFELVLRNLFENSQKYAPGQAVLIEIASTAPDSWTIYYRDHGTFSGDVSRLGELFYKHNSPRGSGIGLYLCRHLMQKMHGQLLFQLQDQSLLQKILVKKATSV